MVLARSACRNMADVARPPVFRFNHSRCLFRTPSTTSGKLVFGGHVLCEHSYDGLPYQLLLASRSRAPLSYLAHSGHSQQQAACSIMEPSLKPRFQNYIRSVQGQLHLFLAVFLGAIALSVVTWILRSHFFEPYVRQLPVKTLTGAETLTDRLRSGVAGAHEVHAALERLVDNLLDKPGTKELPTIPEQRDEYRAKAKQQVLPEAREKLVASLYWAWLDQSSVDGNDRLLEQLLVTMPDAVVQNLHRTLVVGNAQQKQRAFQGLLQAQRSGIAQADAVIEYAQRKARRRGESLLLRASELP